MDELNFLLADWLRFNELTDASLMGSNAMPHVGVAGQNELRRKRMLEAEIEKVKMD